MPSMRALPSPSLPSRPTRRARPRAAAAAFAMVLAGLAAGLGALVPALVLSAAPAGAHTSLASSFPAEGEALEAGPPQVELDFAEDVSSVGLALVLTGPDGQLALGEPAASGRPVTAPLAAAAGAGRYTLDWRVVSADGHTVEGEFSFTWQPAEGFQAAAASDAPPVCGAAQASGEAAAPSASTEAPAESGAASGTDPMWVLGTVVAVGVVLFGTLLLLTRRRTTAKR